MQSIRCLGLFAIKNTIKYHKQLSINRNNIIKEKLCVNSFTLNRHVHCSVCLFNKEKTAPVPLRRMKAKSTRDTMQYFVDIKQVQVSGGKGGDGSISFLQLFINDKAGPDGGDGGHGGHVIFEVSRDVTDLSHVLNLTKAEDGVDGRNRDCFGKNADHVVIKVPMGTIVRDIDGNVLADLDEENMMFIGARGGAGGHGNAFFTSDTQQSPKIAEYGATGESKQYVLEVKSMAHVGLIGLPNAGKSTLLRSITRARPKVASYPFTTLKPHLGMVLYDDYEQIAVADLPGLIEDSHKNRGLGITFLKHAERCAALLFILDVSLDESWEQLTLLKNEIQQFSSTLNNRPSLIIANKMDLPGAQENLEKLKEKVSDPIIPISAKMGDNVKKLLQEIRVIYDIELKKKNDEIANLSNYD